MTPPLLVTPNFSRAELACKHCGAMRIRTSSVERLQAVRDKLGFRLPINSGYRCPVHNAAVSQTGPSGPHTYGAFDVRVYGEQAVRLVAAAIEAGFTGIGVNQRGPHDSRFIHLDDLLTPQHPRPMIWSY